MTCLLTISLTVFTINTSHNSSSIHWLLYDCSDALGINLRTFAPLHLILDSLSLDIYRAYILMSYRFYWQSLLRETHCGHPIENANFFSSGFTHLCFLCFLVLIVITCQVLYFHMLYFIYNPT